jgi:glycosyltransferase involved in cell wall biosynthesis
MNTINSRFVSVIIPVFNDAERLQKCLAALENQTYPQDLYEVIVVDNNSDESIEILVNSFKQTVPTHESKLGSYAARNRGISLAKGKILAFTDSDCIPTSDWIENGVAALFGDLNCGIIGGKIELFFRDSKYLNAVELYEDLMAFPQQRHIRKYHFTPTANLFTFKFIFEEIGLFNDQLKSNGDREWCQRAYQQGYEIKYDANTIVKHPARYSLKQITRRYIRMAGGRVDTYKAKYKKVYPYHIIKEVLGNLFLIPKDLLVIILQKKYSFQEKLKIAWVLLVLKFTLNREKMRVMMGGTSHNW